MVWGFLFWRIQHLAAVSEGELVDWLSHLILNQPTISHNFLSHTFSSSVCKIIGYILRNYAFKILYGHFFWIKTSSVFLLNHKLAPNKVHHFIYLFISYCIISITETFSWKVFKEVTSKLISASESFEKINNGDQALCGDFLPAFCRP